MAQSRALEVVHDAALPFLTGSPKRDCLVLNVAASASMYAQLARPPDAIAHALVSEFQKRNPASGAALGPLVYKVAYATAARWGEAPAARAGTLYCS